MLIICENSSLKVGDVQSGPDASVISRSGCGMGVGICDADGFYSSYYLTVLAAAMLYSSYYLTMVIAVTLYSSIWRYQEKIGWYGIAIKYPGIRYYLNITVLSLIRNFISILQICSYYCTSQCIKQLRLVVSHKLKPA